MSSPHLYRLRALRKRLPVDQEVLNRAVSYLQAQEARGVTPILTLGHLQALTFRRFEYQTYCELDRICAREIEPYELHQIPKANGELRYLAEPTYNLKSVQRFLNREVLKKVALHPASHAYQQGKSILTCAKAHLGARWAIRVDVESFFDSFNEKQVYEVYKDLAYPPLLAFQMARLSTRLIASDRAIGAPKKNDSPYCSSNGYMTVLPQGAPTSGALANILSTPLDEALFDFALSHSAVYTRYADDLWFSGSQRRNGRELHRLAKEIEKIVCTYGLNPNRKKTRVLTAKFPIEMLGIRVDLDELRPAKAYKGRIEKLFQEIERSSISAAAQKRQIKPFKLQQRIGGHIAYLDSISKDTAEAYRERLKVIVANAASKPLN